MKKAKDFKGVDIREVWDFRLSIGSPIIYGNEATYKVKIWANDPGEHTKVLLAEYDTGIPTDGTEPEKGFFAALFGDNTQSNEQQAIRLAYAWLHSVRGKYSRDHIEERKGTVALINAMNNKAGALNSQALTAQQAGNTDLYHQKRGELAAHLDVANTRIRQSAEGMNVRIARADAGGAA